MGWLSVMVERKLNLPDMGPTLALMTPSKVVSSILSTESSPGMQSENLSMSSTKSHTASLECSTVMVPSKFMAAPGGEVELGGV